MPSTVTETSRTRCFSLLTSFLGRMSQSSTISCLAACLAGVWGQNIATVEEWLREIQGFVLRAMESHLSEEVTSSAELELLTLIFLLLALFLG